MDIDRRWEVLEGCIDDAVVEVAPPDCRSVNEKVKSFGLRQRRAWSKESRP